MWSISWTFQFPLGRGRRLLQDSLPGQGSTASGAEQIADHSSRGLQGFSPGQSSTQRTVAPNDVLPVPGPRPSRGFHPGQGLHRTVEQNIVFPVSRTRHGGGLPCVYPQQGSTARGGAHAWLRRGDEELVTRLYAELDALQDNYLELSPQQMDRYDEILREISRL